MSKGNETFRDYMESHRSDFSKKLSENGKSPLEIDGIINSGYYLYGDNNSYFTDSFYGHGFTSEFRFSDNMSKSSVVFNEEGRDNRIVSKIHSVEDAFGAVENAMKALNPEIAKRICFRGECRKHTIRRPVPNPFYSYSDGSELLMLPSYWRQFRKSDYMDRPLRAKYSTTLGNSIFSDLILYDGIDIQKLQEYNHNKYGYHTMDDLADFPEPENQELYRRYLTKTHHAHWGNECVSLEQHYGFQTTHLDVTFDLPTALFFAINRFMYVDRGTPSATYVRDDRADSEPTVFCFLFPREDVYYERDRITGYTMFDTTPSLRPIRQKCTVFRSDALEINWAARHVVLELKLDRDFVTDGIPTYEYLFPSHDQDIFYAKLLEQKRLQPDVWESIIEYE